MKYFVFNVFFVLLLFSCKSDKKNTPTVPLAANNITSIDSININRKQESKDLKEKLVGKTCSYLSSSEFEKFYIPGGFLIGSTYQNEHILDGKIFGITRINGKKEDEKNHNTHLILKQSYEDEKFPCKIIDVLDIEKETDIFKKFPNKDIDIYTDVLQNGNRAPELLALVEYEESEVMTNVYKVWRANRRTGKFEEVKDISGITVVNEDY
ncbi:hypothetical protein [Tenacibaculum geojense]|uniref:Lipoprotein n=1 Tax=Tenacibaculum geojense TaxID=915352 RepID=A0ABW3JT51_9FLAO